MKKLTKRVAALLSIGCAAFLGLFLPSCGKSEEEGEDEDDISLAYGCPYVDFDVKARVLTPDGKPIEGVEVTLLERSYESDGDFVSLSVIGRTDANGVAQISDSQTGVDVQKIYVQAEDGDGAENGEWATKVDSVAITPDDRRNAESKGDWYQGIIKKEITLTMEPVSNKKSSK